MRVVVRKREGSDGHASENECHEEREVAVPSYRLNRWRRWRLVHPTAKRKHALAPDLG